MKVAYSFSILRYVHDPVTQEFVNMGVAILSNDAKYFRATCTTNYSRITNLFEKIDGPRFRQFARHVQDRICSAGKSWESNLPFDAHHNIGQMLAKVLPPDDSAIQFSPAGVGLSSDLDRTLGDLYDRYVERYIVSSEVIRRTDDEVWRIFREPLDRAFVTPQLVSKRIIAPSYEYEFQRSWKNEIWHLYEPVSLDLVDAGSMLDKANRWVGRATSLMDSPESFSICILLGEPSDSRLKETFVKAQNILNKMPVKKEFIHESEAEAFAEELAREVSTHHA